MNNRLVCLVAFLLCGFLFAGPIEDLKPGEWYEVPASNLTRVAPVGYSANVMAAWSGGAFDTKRDRLIVWGGGHGDYVGNEVYVFDLNTLQWSRVNNPSNPPAKDVPYAADGGPCSRHTYDYIQYLPTIDRFVTFGGAGFWQSGQTGTSHTDAFDFDSLKWTQLADVPSRVSSIGAFSAVDASTGRAWQHGAGGKMLVLADYNPANNTWTTHGGMWTEGENDFSYYLTGAVDTIRKLFVAVGGGAGWIYHTDSANTQVGEKLVSTGDTAIMNTPSPGFEYDPVSDRFVAWSGGANIYTLNMDTKVWTRHLPAATNTVVPTAAASNGTFGRFRYSPKKNVFVTVNTITGNVYIYKLTSAPNTTKEKIVSLPSRATFSVHPNPMTAAAILTIKNLPEGSRRIEIFNAAGKRVVSAVPSSPLAWSWKLGGQRSQGVYIVRIHHQGGVVSRAVTLL